MCECMLQVITPEGALSVKKFVRIKCISLPRWIGNNITQVQMSIYTPTTWRDTRLYQTNNKILLELFILVITVVMEVHSSR